MLAYAVAFLFPHRIALGLLSNGGPPESLDRRNDASIEEADLGPGPLSDEIRDFFRSIYFGVSFVVREHLR